nr:hypothetical protein [Tanacetum cinerariifolium]
NQATIQDDKVVVQNVQGRQNRGQENNAWGAGAASYEGAQNKVGYANLEYFKDKILMMQAQENGVTLDEEQLLFIAGRQDNVVDDDVDEQPIQDLALTVDNVFQADNCDVFDSDVDEAPTAQTMFMANLSSADPVYDEAGPSYDSNVLFEVHDHYQDVVCEHYEVHEMHDDVQPNYVVDSHTSYTSDSNMILYDQYVKDNIVQVVQSDVSAVPNDAYMMILNDMHEPPAQHVYVTTQTKKENQYLEEFLDMKALKEKVEDKLFKQDQSLQTVHMLCKPKPYYDEQRKAAIGYKIPLYLARAKQVQPALYNGHEIIKIDHVSAIVHNSEDNLEIAKITRKKMNEKRKTPLWTHHKINIRPLDYSKENFLMTFTPQAQLTPEQIFWSNDVLIMKTKALKEQAKAAKPVKALTLYPPNTPVKLIPWVLPTKSQVKLTFFSLIQLFQNLKRLVKRELHQRVSLKGKEILNKHRNVISPRNNREVHLDYLKHLKESVATLREIVKEAKVERPFDRSVASTCLYTKLSQELLEYKPKDVKQVWKATGTLLNVGYQWKPTRRIFTLREQCPLTRFTHPKVVPTKQPKNVSTSKSMIIENSSHTSQKPLTRYQRRNKQNKAVPAGIPTPTDAAM